MTTDRAIILERVVADFLLEESSRRGQVTVVATTK
jgi:hypothetical protein